MSVHPAFAEGCAAVITGAASGIGLADQLGDALAAAAGEVAAAAQGGWRVANGPHGHEPDRCGRGVARRSLCGFGEVGLLMNNAGAAPGAWTPDQVVDMLLESVSRGDFHILCPDNEVTRTVDERRILWAAGDIVEDRPALSRWHKDHGKAFARFLGEARGQGDRSR